jgi:predicted hotdog family 3-hydroxylacyl-ACP dehydratase
MVLLDEILAWDGRNIRCAATSHSRPDNPLRKDGRLAAVCGIEYGAQAMAVHGALVTSEGPRLGVLAGLRGIHLAVARLDDIGERLLVGAQLIKSERSGVVYRFAVSVADRELVAGRATVIWMAG